MSTLREAAQQALETLEALSGAENIIWVQKRAEIEVKHLRAVLAQPEQEPVAWQVHPFDYGIGFEGVYAMTQRPDQVKAWERKGWTVQPLYTHPPRREWQRLSEEEISRAYFASASHTEYARAVEAALKEKNA
jgi:hypothetical protein